MAGEKKRQVFDPWLIPPTLPESSETPPTAGPLTVSQITASIKQAISRSFPATVHVLGQISNLKRNTSGHLYLTLKDSHSELPCVMWRTDALRLKFKPADGLEVVASGGIEVFDRAGRYQLYIRRLEPRGVGSLELAFRQMCERLEKEGLFDGRHKKKLPGFPRRIALVTSPTGAAVSDILRTISRRFPCVHVLIFPVRVQGAEAANEIASAIRLANAQSPALDGIDVLIVGRGGGSLEDLWAFNEEPVARAIFASRIPVISGVGHEVDMTIADLVADARAATPTAAAQMAVPVLDDVLNGLTGMQARLGRGVRVRWESAAARSRAVLQRSPLRDPLSLIRERGQTVDVLAHELHHGQLQRLGELRARLERIERVIRQIAPYAVVSGLSARLVRQERVMRESLRRKITIRTRTAETAWLRLERMSPTGLLPAARQRLSQGHRRLIAAEQRTLVDLAARLKSISGLLQAVSHNRVLERGYSITRLRGQNRVVKSMTDVHAGERIVTQVRDGEFESTVQPS